jgi:DNA adenine methylase
MQPALKSITPWVGSKRGRKLRAIAEMVPPHARFIDAFAGGGSVVLGIASPIARIGDANPELVSVYQALKHSGCAPLAAALDAFADHGTKGQFNAVRDGPLPDDLVARAARFLYLVRRSFGNLVRYNRDGKFNASYGNRGEVALYDRENLARVADYLASPGVEIVAGDYRDSLADAGPGDLCYMDPPYVGRTFGGYTPGAFDHAQCRDVLLRLDACGVKIIASNSNDPGVHELFADALADGRFRIKAVPTSRGFRSAGATDTLMWNF